MSKPYFLRLAVVGMALVFSSPIFAGEKTGDKMSKHETGHLMVMPDKLTWNAGPASLPQGAEMAVMQGDPTQAGPFTMRLRLPANYRIPPHWHPAIEHVTVVSGSFHMGMGETFDQSKAKRLPTGGFAVMDIGTRHFAFTTEEAAIVQLHGIGPWGITYVNPADDPRAQVSK